MRENFFAKKNILSFYSLGLAVVLFFAVNIFSNVVFNASILDLTQNELYTLTKGTKNIIENLDEPISLKLYFSKKLAKTSGSLKSYAGRVQDLLSQYENISGGKISVEYIDPEPFSEQEDIAIAYGLSGIPINDSGSAFYFGLVGSNSTDIEKIIPFLQQNRETFLEYDITQLIQQLNQDEQPELALISSLPIQGSDSAPAWNIYKNMDQYFNVKMLAQNVASIPESTKLLVLIQPNKISKKAIQAIAKYAHSGGSILAFFDPYVETISEKSLTKKSAANFVELLESWGVAFDNDNIVSDISNAKKVWVEKNGKQILLDYPLWQDLNNTYIAKDDLTTAQLELLTIASAGYFKILAGSDLKIETLFESSKNSMLIPNDKIEDYRKNPAKLVSDFASTDISYPYALRISGNVPLLNTDKKTKTNKDDKIKLPDYAQFDLKPANIILVSDTDLLYDKFWIQVQNLFGQSVLTPTASNGSFVMNVLDNLTGSNDLISIRSRGKYSRPFTYLDDIQKQAQQQYSQVEKNLQLRLEQTQQRLAKLNDHTIDDQKLILSQAQQDEIIAFKSEQIEIRKKLREVKRNLQKDIDRISSNIKFINIGLMPLFVGLCGIGTAVYRRRRR